MSFGIEWVHSLGSFKTVYPRLYRLARAVQEQEGWYEGSRSFRNNNPGNLRSSRFTDHQEGGFAKFDDYFHGMYGLMWDLWCKCSSKTTTRLKPHSTIGELAAVYAPKEDGNDPESYAQNVAVFLDIPIDTKLSYFVEG
ncbi:MAG: hypothetical protein ACFFFO_16970 [Candidatus Thorarchaeota archaeon]